MRNTLTKDWNWYNYGKEWVGLVFSSEEVKHQMDDITDIYNLEHYKKKFRENKCSTVFKSKYLKNNDFFKCHLEKKEEGGKFFL